MFEIFLNKKLEKTNKETRKGQQTVMEALARRLRCRQGEERARNCPGSAWLCVALCCQVCGVTKARARLTQVL